MNARKWATIAVLLCAALTPAICPGQAAAGHVTPAQPAAPQTRIPATATAPAPSTTPSATPETTPAATPTATPPPASASPANEYQQPHITIATPAPAPAPWPLQDRIAWAANLLLLLIAYVGVLMAVSTLRKIERQTRSTEATAQAAAETAQAALQFAKDQAQAQAHAERPWILITPEPTPGVPNGFNVVAANRGRSPARIVSMADEITIAKDESQLAAATAFKAGSPASRDPIILLPGETLGIKSIRREDVNTICTSPEDLRRVEEWEVRIFLLGKIVYEDLTSSGNWQSHETSWCCWYIHGRQKSGLVIAGPREYNQHT